MFERNDKIYIIVPSMLLLFSIFLFLGLLLYAHQFQLAVHGEEMRNQAESIKLLVKSHQGLIVQHHEFLVAHEQQVIATQSNTILLSTIAFVSTIGFVVMCVTVLKNLDRIERLNLDLNGDLGRAVEGMNRFDIMYRGNTEAYTAHIDLLTRQIEHLSGQINTINLMLAQPEIIDAINALAAAQGIIN